MPRKIDLSKVPDKELFAEYKKRYAARREELGPYFAMRKFRICKGCKRMFSARELRTHKCVISWKKR